MLLDQLSYTSRLRSVNSTLKFIYALAALLICVASHHLTAALTAVFINSILTIAVGRIPAKFYFKFMLVPVSFLLIGALAIIVDFPKVYYPEALLALPAGSFYITILPSSLMRGIELIITATGAVSCLYFLSLSTPLTDIMMTLKRLKCPALFIELMLLIYRFIFVILQIASDLTTARNSRLGNASFSTSVKTMGQLFSILLIRSFKKTSALYDSMEARCYDGTIRVLYDDQPLRAGHAVLGGCFLLLMILSTIR